MIDCFHLEFDFEFPIAKRLAIQFTSNWTQAVRTQSVKVADQKRFVTVFKKAFGTAVPGVSLGDVESMPEDFGCFQFAS